MILLLTRAFFRIALFFFVFILLGSWLNHDSFWLPIAEVGTIASAVGIVIGLVLKRIGIKTP